MNGKRKLSTRQIAILVCVSVTVLLVAAILLPSILLWKHDHRYLTIKEDSDVVGLTLAEVEEKYGEFYYQITNFYSVGCRKIHDQDYQRTDECYYVIRPFRKGFLGGHWPEVLIVYFRDGVATGYRTEITDMLRGDGSEKRRYLEYVDHVLQPPGSITETLHFETPSLTFTNQTAYESFATGADLPENFVFYDQIAPLGSFASCMFLSDVSKKDYTSYMYTVVEESGRSLVIQIDQNGRTLNATDTISESNINPENMRSLRQNQSGTYTYHGIQYRYTSGDLVSIAWEKNGTVFTISHIHSYGYHSTKFAMLLNLEYAESVPDYYLFKP